MEHLVRNRHVVTPVLTAIAVLLALALAPSQSEARRGKRASSAKSAAPVVLVLPFTATQQVNPDYLSPGIAAYLAEGLRAAGLRTMGQAEAAAWLRARGRADEASQSPVDLARSVGAAYVVSGYWQPEGTDLINVSASTWDVAADARDRESARQAQVHQLASMLSQIALDLAGTTGEPNRQRIEELSRVQFHELSQWMRSVRDPGSKSMPAPPVER